LHKSINNIMTYTERIKKALKEQGLKKAWLGLQLGITSTSISNKLRLNNWTVSEKFFINHLLNIKEE